MSTIGKLWPVLGVVGPQGWTSTWPWPSGSEPSLMPSKLVRHITPSYTLDPWVVVVVVVVEEKKGRRLVMVVVHLFSSGER